MTSEDVLNYALAITVVAGPLGTGAVAMLAYLKIGKVEKHTNGMVGILTKQAASEARIDERHNNVKRGGTTGKEELP